jgi:hypothetical protein
MEIEGKRSKASKTQVLQQSVQRGVFTDLENHLAIPCHPESDGDGPVGLELLGERSGANKTKVLIRGDGRRVLMRPKVFRNLMAAIREE